jgi:hypothetical protein
MGESQPNTIDSDNPFAFSIFQQLDDVLGIEAAEPEGTSSESVSGNDVLPRARSPSMARASSNA